MMSSDYDEWETPPQFFNYLDHEFNFTLDPCCTPETAKCDKYYTPKDDGLKQDWSGERVFVNPPYGREIKDWVKKCWEESKDAEVIVLLIPARTDTQYWHKYVMRAQEIRLIEGRLYFLKEGEQTDRATFPSAVIVFDKQNGKGYPDVSQIRDWKNESLEDVDYNNGDAK